MPLITFIRDNHEAIISEFAAFARTLMPPGADMNEQQLRDHAEEILTAFTADMELVQSSREQSLKAMGHGSARTMAESGRRHADDRIRHGFSFEAVLAEFRALRATVLRLYEESGQTDLHQVRRFNEAVDESLAESMKRFAEQTDLFRNQLIGIVSHDLRNPLGAITTGAALLARLTDPHQREHVLGRITSSAQRMDRMIADLLDLTQVRLGGAMPVNPRPTDLQRVCEDAVGEILAMRPDAVLSLDASGDLRGEWDPDRLRQAISNLLGNAVQHGDGATIRLTVADQGDAVTLSVHNGGAPIPPHVLPWVFEPLVRGGNAHAGMHSLGLGLFIAHAVVAAHGGDIEATSTAVKGTTFMVRLPKGTASRPTTSTHVLPTRA